MRCWFERPHLPDENHRVDIKPLLNTETDQIFFWIPMAIFRLTLVFPSCPMIFMVFPKLSHVFHVFLSCPMIFTFFSQVFLCFSCFFLSYPMIFMVFPKFSRSSQHFSGGPRQVDQGAPHLDDQNPSGDVSLGATQLVMVGRDLECSLNQPFTIHYNIYIYIYITI